MRTLNQYIGRSFASSFVLAAVVLTFVMSLVSLFQITDLLARGVPLGLILSFFLWSMPALLVFTIPVSVLTSALLLFGRLSHEGELTAMRACGISLWQAARRPILYSLLLTAVCLAVNFELTPRIERRQRAFRDRMRSEFALTLLEEGQFVEIANHRSVYVWRKKGNALKKIVVADRSEGFLRRIEAETGVVQVSPDRLFLELDLRSVRISPFIDGKSASGFCERWPIRIPLTKDGGKAPSTPPSALTLKELMAAVGEHNPVTGRTPNPVERLRLVVEVNIRVVMALACLAFVLLGIPLGVRNPRRESAVSVGISLLLAFIFYLFIVAAETLGRRPEMVPHLFVWFPIPVSFILGSWLFRRLN